MHIRTHTHTLSVYTLSVSSVSHFIHLSLVFFSVRMCSPHDYGQAYLYVQFESRRRGYIDDVEFLLADGTMQLRTSSRLGYLDLGVNAKVSLYISGKKKKAVLLPYSPNMSHTPISCPHESIRVNQSQSESIRVNQSQSSRPPRCMFVSFLFCSHSAAFQLAGASVRSIKRLERFADSATGA